MFSLFNKKNKSFQQFDELLPNIELTKLRKIKYESITSLKKLFHDVQLFVMMEKLDPHYFLERLGNIQVGIATSSNSTQLQKMDKFRNFVENTKAKDIHKYVFHNVKNDPQASEILPEMIPIPSFIPTQKMEDLRISRLYAGVKYSGTNIHQHSAALNYLISGKKLWVSMPFNPKNKAFIEKHNMRYGQVKDTALDWLLKNYELLSSSNEIKDLKFFIQSPGEVAFVPLGCYHAVVNLENVTGITYSWIDKGLKPQKK